MWPFSHAACFHWIAFQTEVGQLTWPEGSKYSLHCSWLEEACGQIDESNAIGLGGFEWDFIFVFLIWVVFLLYLQWQERCGLRFLLIVYLEWPNHSLVMHVLFYITWLSWHMVSSVHLFEWIFLYTNIHNILLKFMNTSLFLMDRNRKWATTSQRLFLRTRLGHPQWLLLRLTLRQLEECLQQVPLLLPNHVTTKLNQYFPPPILNFCLIEFNLPFRKWSHYSDYCCTCGSSINTYDLSSLSGWNWDFNKNWTRHDCLHIRCCYCLAWVSSYIHFCFHFFSISQVFELSVQYVILF